MRGHKWPLMKSVARDSFRRGSSSQELYIKPVAPNLLFDTRARIRRYCPIVLVIADIAQRSHLTDLPDALVWRFLYQKNSPSVLTISKIGRCKIHARGGVRRVTARIAAPVDHGRGRIAAPENQLIGIACRQVDGCPSEIKPVGGFFVVLRIKQADASSARPGRWSERRHAR